MRYLFFLIFITSLSLVSFGQQHQKKVENISEKSIVSFLNKVDSSFIKHSNNFIIKFFIVSNGSGSVNIPEGHEVTYQVVVSVAEYDEYPINKVFSIGPFYMPKILAGKQIKDQYSIIVESGFSGERKRNTLLIDVNKVLLK